jgi:hypothetical protein
MVPGRPEQGIPRHRGIMSAWERGAQRACDPCGASLMSAGAHAGRSRGGPLRARPAHVTRSGVVGGQVPWRRAPIVSSVPAPPPVTDHPRSAALAGSDHGAAVVPDGRSVGRRYNDVSNGRRGSSHGGGLHQKRGESPGASRAGKPFSQGGVAHGVGASGRSRP